MLCINKKNSRLFFFISLSTPLSQLSSLALNSLNLSQQMAIQSSVASISLNLLQLQMLFVLGSDLCTFVLGSQRRIRYARKKKAPSLFSFASDEPKGICSILFRFFNFSIFQFFNFSFVYVGCMCESVYIYMCMCISLC